VDKHNSLKRRRTAELSEALLVNCPQKRGQHEEQARAYAKIIDAVSRKKRELSMSQRS